jgi:hypothetical protein
MAVNPNNGSQITTRVSNESGSSFAQNVTNVVSTSSNIVVGSGGVADTVVTGIVGQAAQPVVDIATKATQAASLVNNPTLGGALSLLGRGYPPYRNELDQFASYNSIFTLGCLTNVELNFPLSYRTMGPLIKVIKSGGTGGNKIPTIYETDGKVEFFIDDVEIKNHCAPNPGTRLSNAMTVTFKVIEPYSMGQFLHNLRTAALVAGHMNYIDAPFLLSVAFKGYDDDGNVKAPLFSQRHFPIRIVRADMKVTESGAVYNVACAAYNDMASSDTTQTTTQDTVIQGDTVGQVLQSGPESLTAKINETQARLQSADQIPAADQYVISFPQSGLLDSIGGTFASQVNAATVSLGNTLQDVYEGITGDTSGEFNSAAVSEAQAELQAQTSMSALGATLKTSADAQGTWNKIGKSKIVEDANDPGRFPFQEAGFAEDEENPGYFTRGNLTYDTENRVFTFAAGSRVQDIIEEVVLLSEYGREFASSQPDMFGMVDWVRIETQVYNGTSFLNAGVTGQDPKVYVYRVVPYKVDISNVAAPRSAVLSTFTRQARAIKSYNYIYTGQNTDIVDFDLNFNMAFYTGVQGSRGQRQQDSVFGSIASWVRGDQEPASTTGGGGSGPADTSGASVIRNTNETDRPANGGGAREGSIVSVARQLNDMLIHSFNDMIQVDLTIHGDPYFLADAGIGNFVGIANPVNSMITIDGSMNPIDGEVHVVLNFRTPIDYDDESGFVKYPLGGFLPIAMFSGVYQVMLVENNFKDGVFTQTLKLNRKRNQDLTLESIASAIIADLKGGRAIGEGTENNRVDPVPEAGEDR